jgi:hypothetical protein
MSGLCHRRLASLLPLAALLASLLLPSLHALAGHHLEGAGAAGPPAWAAATGAADGGGATASAEPEACSLCRAMVQARSLLAPSERSRFAVRPGGDHRLHVSSAPVLPRERSAAPAAPRAPPSLPQHA